MRTIRNIAEDVRTRLKRAFRTVRLSTATVTPQLLNEIKAVSVSGLPAAIAVLDQGGWDDAARVMSLTLTVVVVDRFTAGSDERALSGLGALDALLAVFPPDSTDDSGVHYIPRRLYAATGDPAFSCHALELEAHQA